MTKSQTKLIVIILFGWLGVHKFMEKNATLGIVYLLTFGLFCIGWIIDIVKALIEVLDESKNKNNPNYDRKQVSAPAPVCTPPVKPESEKNYNLFDEYMEDYYLAYEYEEKIAIPVINIITGNGGKKITFKQEPENEYDRHAVALYLNEEKIGYLYRGRTQDMVNDWVKKGDFFWGYINKIDVENTTATFKIGFYKCIDDLEMKSFRLTRVTKKVSEYGNSRFENLECCSDGDIVTYETSYETDNYIITDEGGNELGELGTKAGEWINENEGSIKLVRINNIEKTESGSLKADIEFFYR